DEALGLQNDVGILSNHGDTATIVTLDSMSEGTHFLASDPRHTVGQKLVRVNVSDILSKGAYPAQALLSFALPRSFDEPQFKSLCEGVEAEFKAWQIDLVGGDTIGTDGPLVLSLVLTGQCVRQGPIPRSGASPGDRLFVTGEIGNGDLGLQAVLGEGSDNHKAKYRVPGIPHREWIGLLADFASASLDVSDGLLSDAGHLAFASNVAVEIDLYRVPWAEHGISLERMLNLATGGDDYQTLFTVSPGKLDEFRRKAADTGVEAIEIGEIETGEGVRIHNSGEFVPLPPVKGYEH
ncbi:MAG: thiamine-phosphate kinase, partial [Henriciella sp.]|uniref:thiamine-phosphate kinase n=1 Tax=Henriciella sp. TaxID=1968823 RepID=UPI003C75EB64